jgi:actin-related protein 6
VGVVDKVLSMESERFSIPEILFHPSDIGMEQAGVAEAAAQSLDCLEPVSH